MARHSGTTHLIDQFEYTHLPAHLLIVSKPFADLAIHTAKLLKDGPELTAALRKLLEAKDCAVRQALIDVRKHENHVHAQVAGPPLSVKLEDSPESDAKAQESAEKPLVAPTGTIIDGLLAAIPNYIKPWKIVTGEDGEKYWEVVRPVPVKPADEPQVEPIQCRCPKGGKHHSASHPRGALSVNEVRAHEGLPPREYNWKEQRC